MLKGTVLRLLTASKPKVPGKGRGWEGHLHDHLELDLRGRVEEEGTLGRKSSGWSLQSVSKVESRAILVLP